MKGGVGDLKMDQVRHEAIMQVREVNATRKRYIQPEFTSAMQVLAQAVGRGLDASGMSVEELLRKVMGVTPVRHVAPTYLHMAQIETTNNHTRPRKKNF